MEMFWCTIDRSGWQTKSEIGVCRPLNRERESPVDSLVGGSMMNTKIVLYVLLIVAVVCGCAFAQSTGATLQGTVTDPSDSAVPNVRSS